MPSVIERMREALNQHDLESFLECFDDEIVHVRELPGLRGTAAPPHERRRNGVGRVALEGYGAEHGRGDRYGGGGRQHRLGAVVHGAGRWRPLSTNAAT